jgi:hypothetical protein
MPAGNQHPSFHHNEKKTMQTRTVPTRFNAKSFVTVAVALLTFCARADYQSAVLSDGPKAYYRLNDDTSRGLLHTNLGSLGTAGNAINDQMTFKSGPGTIGTSPTGVVHPFPGAIVGDGNRSEFYDFTTRSEIPWNAAFNTPANQPFTVEAWFYPASDQTAGHGTTGQAKLYKKDLEEVLKTAPRIGNIQAGR